MTRFLSNTFLVLIVLWLAACVSKERLSSPAGLPGSPDSPDELPVMTEPMNEPGRMIEDTINRKLIRRGNVTALGIREGTLAVRICIDQSGKVTSSTFIPERSMKSNRAFIARVEGVAREYVFEANPEAPSEQCGNLTFVFRHHQ
jgi:hypothetical protein